MYPNYNYPGGGLPGGGYPYMQPPQPQLLPPPMMPMPHPMQPPVVPQSFNDEFTKWQQWNSHFATNPAQTWRHQAAATVRPTPYDHPNAMQHQVPYGGRPFVPRDLSGPNANTMRAPPVPPTVNTQNEPDAFYANTVPKLEFDVNVSSIRLEIVWKPPHVSGQISYELHVAEGRSMPFSLQFPTGATKHTIRAKAGEFYGITIAARKTSNGVVVAQGQRRIKAIFSEYELRLLHDKAVAFTGTRMHPFELLYRCKPKPYWDDIHHNCASVMEKYMKDDNGQPANMINGVISGLFFSARLLPNGTLPSSSPFGNVRMLVQAFSLLDPENVNIYFADFYCNRAAHYVTICVARKGSESDVYCSKYLLRLDMRNNPWLKYLIRQDGGEWKFLFYAAHSVWVEILYTENVPLSWGRFDKIEAVGLGTSKIGGLSNNKSCNTCNLYPPSVLAAAAKAEAAAAAAAAAAAKKEEDRRREERGEKRDENRPPSPKVPIEQPKYEDLDEHQEGENEDEEEEEHEGNGAFEMGVNSTFQTLINLSNVHDYAGWTDLIECVCEVVDGVVMMEQQEKDRQITTFNSLADQQVARALEEMDSVVGACDDDRIHDLAGEVHELNDWWQRARDELSKMIDQRNLLVAAREEKAAAAAAVAAAAKKRPSGEDDLDEYLDEEEEEKPKLTPSAMTPRPAAAAATPVPVQQLQPLAWTLAAAAAVPLPPSPIVATPPAAAATKDAELTPRQRKKREQQRLKKVKEEELLDEYLDDDEGKETTVAASPKETTVPQQPTTVTPAPTAPEKPLLDNSAVELSLFDETGEATILAPPTTVTPRPESTTDAASISKRQMKKEIKQEPSEGEDEWLDEEEKKEEGGGERKRGGGEDEGETEEKRIKTELEIKIETSDEELLLMSGPHSFIDITQEMEDELLK